MLCAFYRDRDLNFLPIDGVNATMCGEHSQMPMMSRFFEF
jgi:hypothetical protein